MGVSEHCFLYFAYGSNMLSKRIHINNPTAVRKTIGKLQNYRLDFKYQSQRWKGAAATVVPDSNHFVWGTVWEIHNCNMEDLDRQEGVYGNVYNPFEVAVTTPTGESLLCRCYHLVDQPEALKDGEELPEFRQPSKIYMDTIIGGAKESVIPEDYINFLFKIPHNGYNGQIYHDFDLNIK